MSKGDTIGLKMEMYKGNLKGWLEGLYVQYNHRAFVGSDPLSFLYDFEDIYNREIVALVASSLAYGRVEQISKSICLVLKRMPAPLTFLKDSSFDLLRGTFFDFKHRFTTGEELAALLFGAKGLIERYGSLYKCFLSFMHNRDKTVLPALIKFIEQLASAAQCSHNSLIPIAKGGSAYKRLNLFLRWMVREDNVDPGGWSNISKGKLIVPLDTHLHRICRTLNLTSRKQSDIRTACEITDAFRSINPEDPVKYDFVLTRLGMWRKDNPLSPLSPLNNP